MKVKDPVCGMTIDEEKAAATTGYGGKDFRFCSRSCREKFEKDPAAYIKDAGSEEKPSPEKKRRRADPSCPTCGRELISDVPHEHASKEEWTCPMHPEILRDAPGSCS